MPDFVTLGPVALRALGRYQRLRDEAARLRLVRLEARAMVRLADALAPGFTSPRPTELRTQVALRSQAALARRKSKALDRLLRLDRGIRFAEQLARVSRATAGLGRGPTEGGR